MSPSKSAVVFSISFVVLSVVSTVIGLSNSLLVLNENQILYLFSTSAQVLAGIYGLTLTGFIFFRSELRREESDDETLSDAIGILKRRYFNLLIFITVFVFTSLILANLAISHEGYGGHSLNILIINSAQSAFLVCLAAIAHFVFDVISPSRIETASKGLQEKIDPGHLGESRGNLEEFVRNYNQIESMLNEYGSSYRFVDFVSYEMKKPRRMSNAKLAEILCRNKRISESLLGKIRELVAIRNSIIHGADPSVSQSLVQMSKDVLEQLTIALERWRQDEL